MIYSFCSETCKNGLRGCQADRPLLFPSLFKAIFFPIVGLVSAQGKTETQMEILDLCYFFLSLLGRWRQYPTCKRCRMFQCELGAAQLPAACPQRCKGLMSQGRVSAPFPVVMCFYEKVACLTGGGRQQKIVVESAFWFCRRVALQNVCFGGRRKAKVNLHLGRKQPPFFLET